MTPVLDETHDAKATSWVESANLSNTDFPIQNLPFGLFHLKDHSPRIGVAIGILVLDLHACAESNLLRSCHGDVLSACTSVSLNRLMSVTRHQRVELRKQLFQLLHAGAASSVREQVENVLYPQSEVSLLVPAQIGDYTDFYASLFHASNVGRMLRPDNPLLPNYKWIPVGYHGRASSIVVSGTSIRRPCGQNMPDGGLPPQFGPSRCLDYELEVGMYVAKGNKLGDPIPISQAEDKAFGVCLVNDWSARDIQSWEYQPLGPFLGKSFATTVSPWVVTLEALAPFRIPAFSRPAADPVPLPHLWDETSEHCGGIDLTLEVAITTPAMRKEKITPHGLSRGSFRDMYWTFAQLITHHSSNGCNLRPGDLLASGTVSGKTPESRGCLLELTQKGERKIHLPTGEELGFLRDGDEIIIRGWCEAAGKARIGLGECVGRIEGHSFAC